MDRKLTSKILLVSILVCTFMFTSTSAALAGGAGMYYQKTVGNLVFTLINPHTGYAGPKFPWCDHVNFHVKKVGGTEIANYHIVRYTSDGTNSCLYI